ncbi:MAG: hypothetical protein KDN19_03795 [Verrucomicrobiae bacterium]|nr:hypothetical protein [Verrucomicrobiae bacterium]
MRGMMRVILRSLTVGILIGVTGGGSGPAKAGDEELPVLLRSLRPVETPAPPFENGRFEPAQGETIAFIGGTNTFDQDRHGFLESRFHLAWPRKNLKLRNLAWQGDVLTYQARPRYFYTEKGDTQPGSVPDSRERTEPGILFIDFGKMESLPGGTWTIEAYREMIEQLSTRTRRLVLVAPTPFFPVGPAKAETEARNERLAEVVADIGKVATENDALFVDLFTPFRTSLEAGFSHDGIHLTESGHRAVADEIAKQLNFPKSPKPDTSPDLSQSLRQAIDRKNRLWQQYYRPTNWAFLFGDRQHVPASRDPVERSERWFLREIDSLPALIAETEADIHRYAGEMAAQNASNQ